MLEDEELIELRERYLYIKAKGVRNSTAQLLKGTQAVYNLAKKFNQTKVLCDFTEIDFQLSMAEAFNLVRIYETRFNDFKSLSIAGVVDEKFFDLAGFWEKISLNRGFNNKAFTNVDNAEKWLNSISLST